MWPWRCPHLATPRPGPPRPRWALLSLPQPLHPHQYVGHGAFARSLVAAESQLRGALINTVRIVTGSAPVSAAALDGGPGQRRRRARRRYRLHSLIGEALICLMNEVEQPHWLQRDTRITEDDCRGRGTAALGHVPSPQRLLSRGA